MSALTAFSSQQGVNREVLWGGGTLGRAADSIESLVAVYVDANTVVKGIAVVDAADGLANTVTLNGNLLTVQALWQFRGTFSNTSTVNDLKFTFGFSNTWGNEAEPTALTRVDPAPVLLVYIVKPIINYTLL